jgi:hypothetical protein
MERTVKDMTDKELLRDIMVGHMLLSFAPEGGESAEIEARGYELADELERRRGLGPLDLRSE